MADKSQQSGSETSGDSGPRQDRRNFLNYMGTILQKSSSERSNDRDLQQDRRIYLKGIGLTFAFTFASVSLFKPTLVIKISEINIINRPADLDRESTKKEWDTGDEDSGNDIGNTVQQEASGGFPDNDEKQEVSGDAGDFPANESPFDDSDQVSADSNTDDVTFGSGYETGTEASDYANP